jgi:hypothetical protein
MAPETQAEGTKSMEHSMWVEINDWTADWVSSENTAAGPAIMWDLDFKDFDTSYVKTVDATPRVQPIMRLKPMWS